MVLHVVMQPVVIRSLRERAADALAHVLNCGALRAQWNHVNLILPIRGGRVFPCLLFLLGQIDRLAATINPMFALVLLVLIFVFLLQ